VSASAALPWLAAGFLSASLFSHTVALRLILLLCGALLAAWVLVRERGAVKALPPVWIPFVLWAAWAALSISWSVEPDRSLKEWRNEVFYCGLALWVCFVAAQSRNALRVMVPIVALAAIAVVAVALYSFASGWEHYLVGLHGGPGDHSSALLTLMPCVVMAGWYARRTQAAFHVQASVVVLAVLLTLSAYATLNRTIWLGFAIQLGLLALLLHSRRAGPAWSTRRKVIAVASIAVVAVAAVGALLAVQAEREATGGTSLGGDHRLLLWPQIIEQVQEQPYTGYGFGRGLLRKPLRAEFGALDGQLWHAHNIALEALVQVGAPGLGLLVFLLGSVIVAGWQSARSADRLAAACGMALLAVVAGMLVRNMTDTLLVRQNALLFWGVTGVLLAWARLPVSRTRGSIA
jgi:O-antigen ligase